MTPESPPEPAPDLPHLPEPPPPSDVLAILRWAIAAFKASGGPARTAIRRYHTAARGGESGSSSESLATVAIAIATDLAMSVAKAFAAVLTGSAALFAETLHSLADTGNTPSRTGYLLVPEAPHRLFMARDLTVQGR
jgi:hypothetical protein